MVGFFEWPDPRAIRGGKKNLKRFNEALSLRRMKHPYSGTDYVKEVKQLKTKGYCVVKNVVPAEVVASIKAELDLYLKDQNRNEVAFAKYRQCLKHCPSIVPLCFHEVPIAIASGYFDCVPGIGTVNLRKSFANNLPPEKTELYHSDPNSLRFLKGFFYLNDVDLKTGPLTYIKGSSNKKFDGWQKKYRWSDNEMERIYGKSSVKHFVAKAGDLILADTTGFHKGLKPKKDRSMLTTTYVVHMEKPKMMISKADHEALSPAQKKVAEFLVVT